MKKLLLSPLLFVLFNAVAQTDCITAFIYPTDVSCAGYNDGEIHLDIPPLLNHPPFEYLWNTGDTTSYIDSLTPGDYFVTITDSLGCELVLGNAGHMDTLVLLQDGDTLEYELYKQIDWFFEGEVLESAQDVEICVVMEHSWLRDLEIELSCPEGKSVLLHDFFSQTGGKIFLGEPVEFDDDSIIPGIGYQYCWIMDADATWWETIEVETLTTLPAGAYLPEESFDTLAGCSLNGMWKLTIRDNWTGDNGVVFDWTIRLEGKEGPLSIREGLEDCTSCYEEYYCMNWLRNTIRNNILYGDNDGNRFSVMQKAHWSNRTIFATIMSNPDIEDRVDYYDCSGNNFFTSIGVGFGDNLLFSADEITDIETIWIYNEMPLEDCSPLRVDTIITPRINCFGDETAQLCAEVQGGFAPYEYHWIGTYSDTLVGSCIQGLAAGIYGLVVEDLNGHRTDTTEVSVNTPDEIGIDIELTPDSLGYNCIPTINILGGVPPYTIEWHFYIVIDRIVVEVTDANGCSAEEMMDCFIVKIDEPEELEGFLIAPNPTSGLFTISNLKTQSKPFDVIIRNMIGQVIFAQKGYSGKERLSIDLSGVAKGVYWIELKQGAVSLVRKLALE